MRKAIAGMAAVSALACHGQAAAHPVISPVPKPVEHSAPAATATQTAQQTVPATDQSGPATVPPTDASEGIADIIVTAQRRSESLQKVPVAITAVNAEQIETAGLRSIPDLALVTPSLVPGAQLIFGQPYLRGIGASVVTAGAESSVALYVDGIYQSRNISLLSSLSNIERVEILNGPQGALYGRNSTGGVISLITKTPEPGLTGRIEAGIGNYGLFETKGYLAGGGDRVQGSATFYRSYRDGYYTNLVTGHDVDRQKDYGFAGKLVFALTDTDKITIGGDYGKFGPDKGVFFNVLSLANTTATIIPGAKASTKPYEIYTNEESRLRGRGKTHAATARYTHSFDFADWNTFGGYRYLKASASADVDFTVVPFIYVQTTQDLTKDYSIESNLISTGKGPVSWLAGVNYFQSDYDYIFEANVSTLQFQRQEVHSFLKTEALAAFGQVDYAFGADDRWKISGGLRYTDEKKSIRGTQRVFVGPTLPLVADQAQPGQSRKSENLSGTAILSYQFARDVNGYAKFASAFKSGLFTASAIFDPSIAPEKVKSYETGLKTRFADGRVQFNNAAFYYDYSNLQVGQLNPAGTSIRYINAAKAELYGFDSTLDVSPAHNLTVSLAASYLHSEYKDFPAGISLTTLPGVLGGAPGNYTPAQLGLPTPTLNGNRLIRAPRLSASASATYKVESGIGDFSLTGAARYTGKYYFDVANLLEQGSYIIVNSSLTWQSPGNGFFARAWVNNLTDKAYINFASRTNTGDFATYAIDRTYGISAGVNF